MALLIGMRALHRAGIVGESDLRQVSMRWAGRALGLA